MSQKSGPSDLLSQARVHTNNKRQKNNWIVLDIAAKPHDHEICEKYFSQIDKLKTHKRVHTGEKPYQCAQCDKCFSQGGTLMRHKLSHDIEEEQFSFNLCVRTFIQALTPRQCMENAF